MTTTTLADVAEQVRSKNAGPFWITFDVFLRDAEDYQRVAASHVTDPEVIAALYAVPHASVRVFLLPHLNAVKISFPRPVTQGSPQDRDMHAGQQYVPLLDLAIPEATARD
ncbi:DUF4387 domain-containing protein [Streptacidiphilus sp. PAMC 29251]